MAYLAMVSEVHAVFPSENSSLLKLFEMSKGRLVCASERDGLESFDYTTLSWAFATAIEANNLLKIAILSINNIL